MSDYPEWAFIGQRHPDGGVVVWGTRDVRSQGHLVDASPTVHVDSYTGRPVGVSPGPPHRFDVTVGAVDEARAATYEEAIGDLLRRWGATVDDPWAVLGGPRVIEGRVIDG